MWHDDSSLWRDTAKKNPSSHCAFNNLGSALINAGSPDEALLALQKSVKVTGGKNADTWAQMALVFDEQRRTAEADAAYKQAVALDARYAKPDLLFDRVDVGKAARGEMEDHRGAELIWANFPISGWAGPWRSRF